MNNVQKWFLIGAVWVIAIGIFMISLQRYAPLSGSGHVVDKWMGLMSREHKKINETFPNPIGRLPEDVLPDIFDTIDK